MQLRIDAISGAAGDMLLAGLIDLGAGESRLADFLHGLHIDGLSLRSREVKRGGIRARQVLLDDAETFADGAAVAPESAPHHHHKHEDHSHETCDHGHDHHDHSHNHAHQSPSHCHDHNHEHSHGPLRHLSDMLAILDRCGLSERARARAERAFRILAEAESIVHGCDVEDVHFHEVGGVDTLGDILGVCYGLELLDIDDLTCGVVATGSGTVRCAHGVLPVPAPATAEILRRYGIPHCSGSVAKELLTPTGAALLAACVSRFETEAAMVTVAIGYGAGKRDFPGQPNVVRLLLGMPVDGSSGVLSDNARRCADAVGGVVDSVWQLTASIDDMTPEDVAYVAECCLEQGALDCSLTSLLMKKGRPGVQLDVLCKDKQRDALAGLLLRQTSTFGLRLSRVDRVICSRESEIVRVEGCDVHVKCGLLGGEVIKRSAEYEDCRQVAIQTGLPLADVMHRALHGAVSKSKDE